MRQDISVNYSVIRDVLRTGDLVLFSGKGGMSAGIKWGTMSQWSHVGMVVRLDGFDFVGLWESTTLSDVADVESGEKRKGVQLVALRERLNRYQGEVAIRRLEGIEIGEKELAGLMAFKGEMNGRGYESNLFELVRSAYDGPMGRNEEDLSSVFCSELVAEAYQRMGLLGEEKASNEYTPADFGQDRFLTLLAGRLSDEILIGRE
ncbi:hypothetical protein KS4_06160 [Poriferisphaera corsica]|uniref:Permuted papain-like amidase enzyme, YaeF/YiiX, C92 family n=1 Tax=Poriferisphaera corsica TaxID=2528020 RepID=A0A517YQS9_9BACT|nr:YiiX/YebB-like N1pC/P60 family cysteine hydrolase [Poriferisphaera corsica]QDU32582.1 hypothetical protein KS4_06160 [Poriferisphaera corsica]